MRKTAAAKPKANAHCTPRCDVETGNNDDVANQGKQAVENGSRQETDDEDQRSGGRPASPELCATQRVTEDAGKAGVSQRGHHHVCGSRRQEDGAIKALEESVVLMGGEADPGGRHVDDAIHRLVEFV